ncbi:uncharacterized protein LOC124888155 isoform X2 [Capsicum annuum]|uniref:uncharacterized protein LOC124888155 isoform X2 n=1 Tax=Capsicum annuum TaxID=4072 RepID=UPI001FB197FC|nr:uncharacterized protein LOC124888155 isoform X2 [Capsicum annuum]
MNSFVSPPDSHFSHSVELNPTSIESKPQPNSQTSWMASRGSSSSSFRGRGGRNSPKGRACNFAEGRWIADRRRPLQTVGWCFNLGRV